MSQWFGWINGRFGRHVLVVVVLGALLIVISPFGVSEVGDRHLANLLNQILAPLYGNTAHDGGETGKELITVVTLTDLHLERDQQQWPAEYGFHAMNLAQIARRDPAAIFLDFHFGQRRVEDTSFQILVDVLDGIESGDYASGAEGPDGRPRKPPLLLLAGDPNECKGGVLPELAGPGARRVVPAPRSSDLEDRHDRIYPLVGNRNDGVGCRRYSAAARLYYEYVANRESAKAKDGSDADPFDWSDFEDDLMLAWGTRFSPDNKLTLGCAETEPTVLKLFGRRLLGRLPSTFKSNCPYHRTLASESLDLAGVDEDLRLYFEGKFVFYGLDRLYSYDRIVPPTHIELPAVHLHAMALDNLIAYGADFLRDGENQPLASISMVLCMLIVLGVAYAAYRELSETDDGDHRRDWRILDGYALATLSSGLILVYVLGTADPQLADFASTRDPVSWVTLVVGIVFLGYWVWHRLKPTTRPPDLLSVCCYVVAVCASLSAVAAGFFKACSIAPLNAVGIAGAAALTFPSAFASLLGGVHTTAEPNSSDKAVTLESQTDQVSEQASPQET